MRRVPYMATIAAMRLNLEIKAFYESPTSIRYLDPAASLATWRRRETQRASIPRLTQGHQREIQRSL
jgi:hypothetical protein